MFYFLLVLLLISPIFINIYNYFLGVKKYNYEFILICFIAPLSIIFTPLTISKWITPNLFIVFFYLWLVIPIIFFTYKTIFLLVKQKIKIDYKHFVKNIFSFEIISYFIGILILLLFLIFSKYYDHDTAYYINISSYFSNGIFSTDGISGIDAKHYLSPTMYFTYGSVFKNNIYESYFLMNPILLFIIVDSLKNNIFNFYKKWNNKIKIISYFISSIFLVFLILGQLNYLSGGNVVFQSLILVTILITFIKNQNKPLWTLLLLTSFSYFSSTGILLSIVASACYLVYLLFFNNFLKTFIYVPYLLFSMFTFVFVFTKLEMNFISSILFILLSYLAIIIQLVTTFFTKKLNVKQIFIYDNYLKDKKWIDILFIAIFVLITIGNILFFSLFYKIKHAPWQLIFLTLAFNILITIRYFFLYFKNGNINSKKIIIFIFMLEAFSIVVLFLQKTIPQFASNESAWRMIYLNFGLGNLTDILLLSLFLFLLFMNQVKLIKIKFNACKWSPLILSSFILLASIFTTLNLYTNIFNYSGVRQNNITIQLNSNCEKNLTYATSNDKNVLKKMNDVKPYTWGYVSDTLLTPYLNNLSDMTSFITHSINNNYMSSYIWNFANFSFGINNWNIRNKNNKDLQLNISDIPRLLLTMVENNYSVNSSFSNINMKTKYIILSNSTSYYANCFQELNETNKFNVNYTNNFTIFEVKNA